MDSLRYWLTEMHVDGFRFDLATTLARQDGGFSRLSAFFDLVAQNVRLLVPCSPAGAMSAPGGKPHKGSSAAANSRPAGAGPPSWGDRRDCDIVPLRLPPVPDDGPRRGRTAQQVSPALALPAGDTRGKSGLRKFARTW
jgi:hypothetical protein